MRRRFSPGVVLGLIAVVLAMSGSAYAAAKVTSAQIKDSTVQGKDIKDRSITGRDIGDASLSVDKLTTESLNSLKGGVGPQGPTGPQGAAGPVGPSVVSKLTPIYGLADLAAGDTDIFTMNCPAGQSVVNGGFTIFLGEVWLSKTYDGRSWSIGISNWDGSIPSTENEVWAFCAPTGSSVAGIASKSANAKMTRGERAAAIKADIARYKAAN